MYKYTPKRKNAYGIIISSVLFTAGILQIVSSFHTDSFTNGFTGSAVFFVLGAIIAVRYVFCSYEYAVEDGTFTVREKRGKRRVTCARIAVYEISRVILVEKRKDKIRPDRGDKVYDYRQSLWPRSYHILVIESGNYCDSCEKLYIKAELDKKLHSILENK